MPAAVQNETAVDNQNPFAAFDALRIDPKARFRFGKWRNFSAEWVRKVEPSYLRWLGDQDWFRADHQNMVTVVDKPKEAKPVVCKPSRRRTEPSVQPDGALDQAESVSRAASPAFTSTGNAIRPTAWSRT
jgi:hypothetical protein